MFPDTLGDLYRYIQLKFNDANIVNADLDARRILERRTDYKWSDMIARPESGVDAACLKEIESDVERRLNAEPLSRIYGVREFWGLEFELSPDTLDPRPDTEILVEAVLKTYEGEHPKTILDMGTGSGCILIALLKEFPQAHGVGTDISAGALEMSQRNARRHGVEDRCDFYKGSWTQALEERNIASFDCIVSNPPYISNQIIPNLAPEVQNHDPILALDGGDDGLNEYKKIISELFSVLNPCGQAFLEIGYDQEKDVVRLAEESRFFIKGVHHDLAGHPRVVEISRGDK